MTDYSVDDKPFSAIAVTLTFTMSRVQSARIYDSKFEQSLCKARKIIVTHC